MFIHPVILPEPTITYLKGHVDVSKTGNIHKPYKSKINPRQKHK